MYIYIHIYIYIHMHTHTYVYRYMCTIIHIYICMYIYMYNIYIYIYIHMQYTSIFICIHTCTDMCVYIYTRAHTHMYTCSCRLCYRPRRVDESRCSWILLLYNLRNENLVQYAVPECRMIFLGLGDVVVEVLWRTKCGPVCTRSISGTEFSKHRYPFDIGNLNRSHKSSESLARLTQVTARNSSVSWMTSRTVMAAVKAHRLLVSALSASHTHEEPPCTLCRF